MKISETISRIRNTIKSVKEDAFLTDRYIYSIIAKHGIALLQKEIHSTGIRNSVIFNKLSCVEMVKVNTVDDSCCVDIPMNTGCTIMKSKYPLPSIINLSSGYLVRTVSSLDYSKKYYYANRDDFNRIFSLTNMRRWNKNGYYYIDDKRYLYIMNDDVPAVTVEAAFYDYSGYVGCNDSVFCDYIGSQVAPFPEHLFAAIESNVLNELSVLIKIPSDPNVDDTKSIMR